MAERETNLTLGAGKLYFDRFDDDGNPTGEFYIGNTTSLTYSVEEERREHYSSDTAERERDESIVLRSTATIGFTTDDIQPENLAMMFKGDKETLVEAGGSAIAENVEIVTKGRWYQLGVDDDNPTGVRLVTITGVDNGGAIANANDVNYEVDAALGRVFIKADAPDIAAGDTVEFTYNVAASTRTIILNKGERVMGALRYIADNTTGDNNDHFFPKVEVSPDGDYEFKGDDWNEMSFSGEVLTKVTAAGTRLEKHYVDGRPVAAVGSS